jgi:hypothetical protein
MVRALMVNNSTIENSDENYGALTATTQLARPLSFILIGVCMYRSSSAQLYHGNMPINQSPLWVLSSLI